MLGVISGVFGDHWVSLETAMGAASCVLFLPPFFLNSLIHCPLFFHFCLMGARAGAGAAAGFIWWAGLGAGLQEGQALGCSSYLGLGLAVPHPMFLLTQPPYATRALINN